MNEKGMNMKGTNLAKVAIHKRADELVDAAMPQINDGFEGGRVSKTDLMSWAIVRVVEQLDEEMIEQIRSQHFNQVAYLDGLVKRLKGTQRDSLSDDEREHLRNLLGPAAPRERTKRRRRSADGDASDRQEDPI
jgi:hypothetical protein